MAKRRKRSKTNPPPSKPAPKPNPPPPQPPPRRGPAFERTPAPPRNLIQEFDSMIRHPRQMLSPREIRIAFAVSLQQVHNWIELGLVVAGDIGSGGERQRRMVTRASALAFYIKRFGWEL